MASVLFPNVQLPEVQFLSGRFPHASAAATAVDMGYLPYETIDGEIYYTSEGVSYNVKSINPESRHGNV